MNLSDNHTASLLVFNFSSYLIVCRAVVHKFKWSIQAVLLSAFIGMLSTGCGNEGTSSEAMSKENIALEINGNIITMEEFTALIRLENAVNPEFDLTPDKQKEFINYLIRREVLIREASRRELDRENDFLRTIERYWESTLIRNLMTRKSQELKKCVLVLDTDIKAFYEANKTDTTPPLETVKEEIRNQLLTEKINERIAGWEQALVQSAKIYKNPQLER